MGLKIIIGVFGVQNILACFNVQKHIIFQILYIIVGTLAPPLSDTSFPYKALLPTSTVCSDWPADPVHCDVMKCVQTSRG